MLYNLWWPLKPENRDGVRKNTNLNVNSNSEQLSGKGQSTTIPDSIPSATPPEKHKLTQDETDLLISKLDLTGIKDWSPKEQK